MKFNNFTQEDMSNPSFKSGIVFDTAETLRATITKYSLRNRVDIKLPRNDKRRVRAHCAEGFLGLCMPGLIAELRLSW